MRAVIETDVELPPMPSDSAHDPSPEIQRQPRGVEASTRHRERELATLPVGITITVGMWQTDRDNKLLGR